MNIHILGICGTLMGSIALLARELGHVVTGSDENVYPPMSTQLEDAGISLTAGYHDDSVPPDTDMVIVGNANLPRGNPALEAVLNRRIPYTSGAEWLSRFLLQDRWVIAAAGTHGKTTTASMIAWILDQADLNPGFLIGGIPRNFGFSSRLGSSPFFVIEADEYDTSYFDRRSKFLHYRPSTVVLNNLEFDHADIFADLEAIKAQFHLLLRSIPGQGLVIHPTGDENIRDVIARGCWTPTLEIGGTSFCADLHSEDGSDFSIVIDGQKQTRVTWDLTGQHNVMNALAAVAASRHAGVAPAVAGAALSNFQSVKRRMEIIFEAPTLTVYDDFAHHPTAIATTLEGLRSRVGDDSIVAVIEPASHTMKLGVHEKRLAEAAAPADTVLWFQPHNVRWDMAQLGTDRSLVTPDPDQLLEATMQQIQNSTGHLHVVVMSNGSFGGFHRQLINRLSAE